MIFFDVFVNSLKNLYFVLNEFLDYQSIHSIRVFINQLFYKIIDNIYSRSGYGSPLSTCSNFPCEIKKSTSVLLHYGNFE